jgi:hypothetical protein
MAAQLIATKFSFLGWRMARNHLAGAAFVDENRGIGPRDARY